MTGRLDVKRRKAPGRTKKNALVALELSLTCISSQHTRLDVARAVAKVVKVEYLTQQSSRPLPISTVRPWLRRFYGLNLTPKQCGALVALLPEYNDPMVPETAIARLEAPEHSRRVDSGRLVQLCAQLADIHRITINKKYKSIPSFLSSSSDYRQETSLFETIPYLLTKLLAVALHPAASTARDYLSSQELNILKSLHGPVSLQSLLSEIGNRGLRKSPHALLALTTTALQRLKSARLNTALLTSLEMLAQGYLHDASRTNNKKLFRALQRNVCIAAAKITYWPDKAYAIERALRTLSQLLNRRAKASSLDYIAAKADDRSLLLRLRHELLNAHKVQALHRFFVIRPNKTNVKAQYELHRLERYQHSASSKKKTRRKSKVDKMKALTRTACPNEEEAAMLLSRFLMQCSCRLLRRRLSRARKDWQRSLESRARTKIGIAARRWLTRKVLEARLASITPEMRREANSKISKSLVRYAHRRRGRALLEAESKRRQVAARSAAASAKQRNIAAARIQAGYRASKARDRAKELVADREQTRVLLLELVSASGLLIADSKHGSSDPLCYVTAQLGAKRGGYAPRGFGPSAHIKNQVISAYAPKKSITPAEQPRHAAFVKGLFSQLYAHPIWLPPTIRARDYDKFEALPQYFPVFSGRSTSKFQTLQPVWNETFLLPGLDPESSICLTVVDVDEVGKDDFLGQATIGLSDLRSLASSQFAHPQRLRTFEKGDYWAKAKQRAICLKDTTSELGQQALPVLDNSHTQVFFESLDGFDRGSIAYRIWVPPRAYSISSYLEERLSRENSMVSFWKTCWCVLGFDQLLVYNSRGDVEPRFTVDVDHIDAVDVIKESQDEVLFTFRVAGGLRHLFRVPEIGYPNQEQLRHAWVRRLRRVSPRIPTNEFAPADSTHSEYLAYSSSHPRETRLFLPTK